MIKKITVFFVVLYLAVGVVPGVFASSIDSTIEELQKKITELKQQENSLSKQINLINSQITITQLRLTSIKEAIDKLTVEIDTLADEITRLEGLLTRRSELVLARIPESYKRQVTPQFGVVFFSSNVSDFFSRLKYMTRVQEQDAQLLFQLKATQNSFSERKDLRESKKIQQVKLQTEFETENRRLDQQKKEKQALLDQTRNDEVTYQKLLAQALAERQALERALVEGVKVGPIKKGEPLALVGNSGYPGCSTGAHLHFEVRKNNTWVSPEDYLSKREVEDQENGGAKVSMGNGGWDWPLDGDFYITQHFGKTPYSWRYSYSGGIHTGIDMNSRTSKVIRAPADGTLFSSSQNCGSSSIIKIKYIEHGDGIISFYLHVQ